MIALDEITSLGWEEIQKYAYIYYGDNFADDPKDFASLKLMDAENWHMKYKDIDTYYGPLTTSTQLQTLMTDFNLI